MHFHTLSVTFFIRTDYCGNNFVRLSVPKAVCTKIKWGHPFCGHKYRVIDPEEETDRDEGEKTYIEDLKG